ncbi:MAG: hypothetical protein IPH75_04705 [bacterium]|nr:hypothetical protein [bacterium]
MGRKLSNSLVFILLACTTISCMSVSALAFDGKRKGFVLGGGIGFAPIAHQARTGSQLSSWETDNYDFDSVVIHATYTPFYDPINRVSIAAQIEIGYGFDEHNILLYREQHAFYSYFDVRSQGMSSITWSHFYGESAGPLFSTVGIGYFFVSNISSSESVGGLGDGLALSIGIGYEFKRHFACELSFSQGRINSGYNRCTNVTLLVSTTAY